MFKLSARLIKPGSFLISLRSYKTDEVRVRFAPSPTGFLHLGGQRTALYNFLFARKHNGKFILRIEDTDQTRLVPGAVESLYEDLKWSGIDIDEGPFVGGDCGPYVQSERLDIYSDKIKQLLKSGTAYHCFCTEKRLQLLKREAVKNQEIPKYDNKCRHLSPEQVQTRLSKGDPSCIRFKISDQEECFNDLIYGTISYNISLNEGDPVIIKSDGFPTYHFANVVDDHLMNITHVLRGVEWQISTTKHLLLYKAFGWTPPLFGHLPLLMNADGTKLSKRQGDIKISHYKEQHIFPLALINFIVHSGGGFKKDLERHLKPKCYTLEELTEQFDLSTINSHSGKLSPERLSEFNNLELKRKLANSEKNELVKQVIMLLKHRFPERVEDNTLNLNEEYILEILLWAQNRISNLSDLISNSFEFIWVKPRPQEIENVDVENLTLLRRHFEDYIDIQPESENVNLMLRNFCKEHNIKFGRFMKIMRLVLSGLKDGPGVSDMISILGKKKTLQRIDECLSNMKAGR